MKKLICIILALMLVVSTCVMLVACNPNVQDEEKPVASVTDGNGQDISNGEHEVPSRMVFAYSGDLATIAENTPIATTTLTATIVPSTATNKYVTWQVAFVNPNSSWASGKNVSDYLTVEADASNSLSATVKCWAPFGEQIKITVVPEDNPEAKSSCVCDYRKHLVSYTMRLSNAEGKGGALSTATSSSNPTKIKFYASGASEANKKYTLAADVVETAGTLNSTYSVSGTIIPVSNFKGYLQNSSFEFYFKYPESTVALDITNGFVADKMFIENKIAYGVLDPGWHEDDWNDAVATLISTMITKNPNACCMKITATLTYNGQARTETYYCGVDWTDLRVAVSGSSVQSSYVFE